ncbi:MAG: Hsp20/alpha crystallin family protein [Bacteroidota bacterium]
MLVRFQPVSNIFDEIDTLINSTMVPFPSTGTFERRNRFTGVTVKDTGEQVHVTVELPGVSKQDVSVNVNNGVLTISGERKQPEKQENEQWLRNEISYGKFERSITLPYSVDVEKVSASQENGILSIILPKHENAKPKQISIR